MLEKPVIAGNWKMHQGPGGTREFFTRFQRVAPERGTILIFPPAVSLPAAAESASGGPVRLGIQNLHWEEAGAFTGETSVSMAREVGAEFALIGHSERRHVFGETDEEVGLKVRSAIAGGLVPVVCVGETLEERSAGRLQEVILRQLDAALDGVGSSSSELLVAYEPVWAIGTGETATPDDAAAAHGMIRSRLQERLGAARAADIPILYGGSVKPANASELLAAPDVDGVLVGGASLDPDSLAAIARSA
jgi:triosephosphate isomerase (TIM)